MDRFVVFMEELTFSSLLIIKKGHYLQVTALKFMF